MSAFCEIAEGNDKLSCCQTFDSYENIKDSCMFQTYGGIPPGRS